MRMIANEGEFRNAKVFTRKTAEYCMTGANAASQNRLWTHFAVSAPWRATTVGKACQSVFSTMDSATTQLVLPGTVSGVGQVLWMAKLNGGYNTAIIQNQGDPDEMYEKKSFYRSIIWGKQTVWVILCRLHCSLTVQHLVDMTVHIFWACMEEIKTLKKGGQRMIFACHDLF